MGNRLWRGAEELAGGEHHDGGFSRLFGETRLELVGVTGPRGSVPFRTVSGGAWDLFAYVEDPDGTLIEFVETHKIPIMNTLNWYLDLQKRGMEKPLPRPLDDKGHGVRASKVECLPGY